MNNDTKKALNTSPPWYQLVLPFSFHLVINVFVEQFLVLTLHICKRDLQREKEHPIRHSHQGQGMK